MHRPLVLVPFHFEAALLPTVCAVCCVDHHHRPCTLTRRLFDVHFGSHSIPLPSLSWPNVAGQSSLACTSAASGAGASAPSCAVAIQSSTPQESTSVLHSAGHSFSAALARDRCHTRTPAWCMSPARHPVEALVNLAHGAHTLFANTRPLSATHDCNQ